MNLGYFKNESLFDSGRKFFSDELVINLSKVATQKIPLHQFLKEQLKGNDAALLNEISEAYFLGLVNDDSLNDVFNNEAKLEEESDKDSDKYKALMVFAIKVKSQDLTRTDIAKLTRAFNRRVVDKPVILLTQYGNHLAFSTAERNKYASVKKQGEKVGKISMLKDIDLDSVHPGHVQILWEMKVNPILISNFDSLYEHWQKVFNVSLLNKNFYNELFDWYLWATKLVKFPKPEKDDIEDGAHASISVIRLLTRLIFVWFIKEKKLIPKEMFNKKFIKELLKSFNPASTEESIYYRAILQNLFFASLNTEMNKDNPGSRRFISNKKAPNNYSEDYQNQLVYRYKELFKDEKEAIRLFENIPFLNGGLFECLDFNESIKGKSVEHRYDGFSSQPKKQAFVPDALFFGENPDLDLSEEYDDDKKKKHTKVRGIIEILNSYKFTITENTPLEEEIALDPELLGRVFENLLASYNPETKTTARKQTGSFYTPREIVNYMVDESLKTYLIQQLSGSKGYLEVGAKQSNMFGNDGKAGQLTMQEEIKENSTELERIMEKIEQLFDYASEENPFHDNPKLTSKLINAIGSCKILDPACGSGAFPMGILHRMVFLLGKLDPNNIIWKEAQLQKAQNDLELAKKMSDDELREKTVEYVEYRIEYIKLSFADNHHELDYTRKLFLIENCIYGVDIQQIAVQISKLRFFISLVVEQRVDDTKANRNVLSMPNLETKFIAANTLVKLEKPSQLQFLNPDVEKYETELKEIRGKIFFTRKYKDKKKLKEQEKVVREKLKDALIDSGFNEGTATQMASWNPFDPIHSALFFDCETMFGFDNGFDIVIGNPPYISVRTKSFNKDWNPIFKANFTLAVGQYDLYVLFIEKATELLSMKGILAYIIPKRMLSNETFKEARQFILENIPIYNYVDAKMPFESANVEANIMIGIKGGQINSVKSFNYDLTTLSFSVNANVDYSVIKLMPFSIFPFVFQKDRLSVLEHIQRLKITPLSEYLEITRGFECGYSDPAISETKSKYPLIYSEAILRYHVIPDKLLYCRPDFDNQSKYKTKELFLTTPKLLTKFVSSTIIFAIDNVGYFNTNSVYNCHLISDQITYEFLLGILNSRLITFWFNTAFLNDDNIFPHIQKNQLDSIPIIIPQKDLFKQVVELVKKYMKSGDDNIEDKLNNLVYDIYNIDNKKKIIIEKYIKGGGE